MSPAVPLARLIRADVPESEHVGSVVVADLEGGVVAAAGDPDRTTFIRSAAKPFQAAASLHLAGEAPGDEEIAVMAASHNAEEVHVRAVRAVLRRAGMTEEDLRCPPGRPLDPDPARPPEPPARILHNCSGKHAGMLLACARGGEDPTTYLSPTHPVQRAAFDLLERASGVAPRDLGVDGCGAPVAAIPLRGLATAFARLADPSRLGPFSAAAEAVVAAMRRTPYLVAGRLRVCTVVMESTEGVLVKVGAEGVAGAVLLDRGLGVAVKVDDGAARARDAALVRALGLLEAVDPGDERLTGFRSPPVRGGEGIAGVFESAFTLGPRGK